MLFCPARTDNWNARWYSNDWSDRFFPHLSGYWTIINTHSRLNSYGWMVPDWASDARHVPYGQSGGSDRYRRWYNWSDRAIIADNVTHSHGNMYWGGNHLTTDPIGIRGWNILYGDGGVVWEDLRQVKSWWRQNYDPTWIFGYYRHPYQSHGRFQTIYQSREGPAFWDVADQHRRTPHGQQ